MADMGKYLNVQELSASQNGEESRDGKNLDGTFVIQKKWSPMLTAFFRPSRNQQAHRKVD